jgi:hypothetical protein
VGFFCDSLPAQQIGKDFLARPRIFLGIGDLFCFSDSYVAGTLHGDVPAGAALIFGQRNLE